MVFLEHGEDEENTALADMVGRFVMIHWSAEEVRHSFNHIIGGIEDGHFLLVPGKLLRNGSLRDYERAEPCAAVGTPGSAFVGRVFAH
ncbi:hypothetical protein GLOTRDRAFT_123787 [Gloeophyllum trabeum ATCC 11539]|uniref:Uncharacterized protein n=1 Tax=Gloeophyllum trabeum (strain ATCC 11539 / FP-39264 / Madison 617) TaxID=670483 RepID=S7S2N5_GLOTA|nr:uncharacterized protein GLOTRDRAFT_123787 [Gloeophyllum trabeum ATCC 11539]EPQ60029.1 hypothetical protein GLOTRDRAFT_123787 [Gloeophyllum trabeum ATCC 11539]